MPGHGCNRAQRGTHPTSVVHGAEELEEIAKTLRDLLVSKTGENLMGQMKTVNASNRGGIMDRVKKSHGFSDTP